MPLPEAGRWPPSLVTQSVYFCALVAGLVGAISGCSREEARPPPGGPAAPVVPSANAAPGEEADLPPANVEEVSVLPGVVGLRSASQHSSVCVVSTDGTVHFLAADDGRITRVLKTGAVAWAEKMTSRVDGSEPPVSVSGIPVALSGDTVLALEGEALVSYDTEGKRTEELRQPSLYGARLHLGSVGSGPVVVVGRDGAIHVIGRRTPSASRATLVASPVVGIRSIDDTVLFFGGAEEALVSVDEGGLGQVWRSSRRLGEPPILAIAADPTGKQIAVSHGTSCRVKTFLLDSKGRLGRWDGYLKKGIPCLTLAYDASGLRLAAGLADGRVIVTSSGTGSERTPHELPEVRTLKVSDTEVVGVSFYGNSSDLVCCARGGLVARYSSSDGAVRWAASVLPGQSGQGKK